MAEAESFFRNRGAAGAPGSRAGTCSICQLSPLSELRLAPGVTRLLEVCSAGIPEVSKDMSIQDRYFEYAEAMGTWMANHGSTLKGS